MNPAGPTAMLLMERRKKLSSKKEESPETAAPKPAVIGIEAPPPQLQVEIQAAPVPVPEVKTPTVMTGSGGYTYQVEPDGNFTILSAPKAGQQGIVVRPSGKNAKAYAAIAAELMAQDPSLATRLAPFVEQARAAGAAVPKPPGAVGQLMQEPTPKPPTVEGRVVAPEAGRGATAFALNPGLEEPPPIPRGSVREAEGPLISEAAQNSSAMARDVRTNLEENRAAAAAAIDAAAKQDRPHPVDVAIAKALQTVLESKGYSFMGNRERGIAIGTALQELGLAPSDATILKYTNMLEALAAGKKPAGYDTALTSQK